MHAIKRFFRDENGDAVIEASILFPIMVLIFFTLVLLSIYLPSRAILQHATQYAATAIATERSDTWLYYNESSMSYGWHTNKSDLDNVYVSTFKSILPSSNGDKAETITTNSESRVMLMPAGEGGSYDGNLEVSFGVTNFVLYKEIIITATRTIPMPLNLDLIQVPNTLPITVTSTAIVQNGDEFIRNMDIAVDFFKYIDKKYKISKNDFVVKLSSGWSRVQGFLGI
ncbi:MAG: hypothetical protein LBT59_12640 [Clostridiales bacterium]|nr:hypothetical protein [Clostridiales bacterium]